MKNKVTLEKAIEVLVLISVPIALVVGCVGIGNMEPVVEDTQVVSAIERHNDLEDVLPAYSRELDSGEVSLISELEPVQDIIENDVMAANVDTNDEIALTQGANSNLALMNEIKMQPSYLVFNFDTDSVAVQEYDHFFLKQHVAYLNSNPDLALKIIGHTDNRGSVVYNKELSQRRADEVTKLLVSFGASKSQIRLKGVGENIPLKDADEWQQNRRVELEYIENTMISAK